MELNNLNWGIYNTYVNFEICILTAKNVEKRKENIRNTFFNFATRPLVQVLQASQKYYMLNSQETNEFIGENNFFLVKCTLQPAKLRSSRLQMFFKIGVLMAYYIHGRTCHIRRPKLRGQFFKRIQQSK